VISIPGLTLVLGGTRSGKTSFAERLTCATNERRTYIATAEALDDEMAMRIALHRQDRGDSWETVEEPRYLTAVLRHVAEDRAVLIDCLTLWLSNMMHDEVDWEEAVGNLLDDISRRDASTVLVSNEIGLGLVPETSLGRRFRDAQGRLNQLVASRASTVVFVAAGLPLILKGSLPEGAA
jgi:adenosylcobinamide kinase / adenosylcobinamide-phosphate guanylyltransferase